MAGRPAAAADRRAYQVKLIWQARTKTDPIDARKLAELARVHLLPAIWIPDLATRALRQLLRGRVFLVRQRTVMWNRIHADLTAENLRCPELDLYSTAGQAWLATVDLPAVVRGQVGLVLANHALRTTPIQALDHHSKASVRRDETARRLQTIPGIGPFGALLLQAEIGPISRFGSAQEPTSTSLTVLRFLNDYSRSDLFTYGAVQVSEARYSGGHSEGWVAYRLTPSERDRDDYGKRCSPFRPEDLPAAPFSRSLALPASAKHPRREPLRGTPDRRRTDEHPRRKW